MLHNQIPHPIRFHAQPKFAAIVDDKIPHRMLVVRRRRQPQHPLRQIQKFRSLHPATFIPARPTEGERETVIFLTLPLESYPYQSGRFGDYKGAAFL